MQLPIQFRCARMFAYRTFATFYGVLSVHLQTDFSLKIVFFNISTSQRVALNLSEDNIERCCGVNREKLRDPVSNRLLCISICEKLYLEYTSCGYELLFPGVKAKGDSRQHPLEITIIEHRDFELKKEQERLTELRKSCVEQVIRIGRRRMEQYHTRMLHLKKVKHELTVKTMQCHSRGHMKRVKIQKQQEAHQRNNMIRNQSAIIIQHQFKTRRVQVRQQRICALRHQENFGTRFRMACRINNTFVLALITLEEIDGPANVVDCTISFIHPITFQTACIQVQHTEMLKLMEQRTFRAWTRRQIVHELITYHLDLFRSMKYGVLATSTKM